VYSRLVLLGPPAAGKGTQAELLKEHFGFAAPSVGAMLREQKAAGTPEGLRAAEYFDRGLLVPDEVTVEVVRQWLAGRQGPWALDGFPRTVGQAEAFDAMLREQNAVVDFALFLQVDEAVIRDRVAHRVVCQRCGGVFRVQAAQFSDPCPKCGGTLGRRTDDTPEALTDRLTEYRNKTEAVISYYEKKRILHSIDGNRPVETVFSDLAAALHDALAIGSGNP
jgi:adenylate kinase